MKDVPYSIRKANTTDLDYIKHLADNHRDEFGFVMRPALDRSIQRQELIVAMNESDIVGFIDYHHRRDTKTTLYHLAVKSDFRKKGIGTSLVKALSYEAKHFGKNVIQLKCPSELQANAFYERIGFQKIGQDAGRIRILSIWQLVI